MNTTSAAAMKFSVEVVILPVRDVDRALRFYVDQVGFTLDVDYSPIEPAGPDFFHVPRQIGSGWIDFRAGSGDVIACPAANFPSSFAKKSSSFWARSPRMFIIASVALNATCVSPKSW